MMSNENSFRINAEQVNISNWLESPFNQWAFHNVDKLLTCKKVANDPQNMRELSFNRSSLLDQFRLKDTGGPDLDLIQFLKATSTDGFVVLKNGKIVYEFYDNGMTAHTPHILMSITKSFTGLIAGMLASNNLINLDKLISDYIPEIAKTAYKRATIRHLMDMRVGNVLDKTQENAYENAVGWRPQSLETAPSNLHQFFAQLPNNSSTHGGSFNYISANTDLLGWVIERISGESFAKLVSELIWKPMGSADDAHMNVDSTGAAQSTRGLSTTSRDLAMFGQLILENGKRNGVEIIPAALLTDIITNGDHEAWKNGAFAQGFANLTMNYRSNWYIIQSEPQYQFAMGIYGQNLFIDQQNEIVVAKFSSQPTPLDFKMIAMTHSAFSAIRGLL
ncbi:serine hydrolase [Pedobacter sp. PAMC26386]|nr:serine hydrolase [Pedobacter sp. PAMC26386]